MRNSKTVGLNLASHPARNRRFYKICLGVLSILLASAVASAVLVFVTFKIKERTVRTALARVEKTALKVRREEKQFSEEAGKAARNRQDRVDLVNGILLRKSFLWTEFLSNLETSLPDTSYITLLAPSLKGPATLQLRLGVVSQSVDDLYAFIARLYERRFRSIRVENENMGEGSRLVSEISLTYERAD